MEKIDSVDKAPLADSDLLPQSKKSSPEINTQSKKSSPVTKTQSTSKKSSPVSKPKSKEPSPASKGTSKTTDAPKKSNYAAFLAKQAASTGPRKLRELPNGQPDCLKGISFVFTGELASIDRESAIDLCRRYGG